MKTNCVLPENTLIHPNDRENCNRGHVHGLCAFCNLDVSTHDETADGLQLSICPNCNRVTCEEHRIGDREFCSDCEKIEGKSMNMRTTTNPVTGRTVRDRCKDCGGKAKHKKTCPIYLAELNRALAEQERINAGWERHRLSRGTIA